MASGLFDSAANRERPERVLTSHVVCHVVRTTCPLSLYTVASVMAV